MLQVQIGHPHSAACLSALFEAYLLPKLPELLGRSLPAQQEPGRLRGALSLWVGLWLCFPPGPFKRLCAALIFEASPLQLSVLKVRSDATTGLLLPHLEVL